MRESIFLAHALSEYASTTTIDPGLTGTVSGEKSAVIGMAGWCFIYEGSNNYRNAYLSESTEGLGTEWARHIEARQAACDRLGIRFLQVVIPNKLSLLPEYFPERLPSDVSYALRGLLRADVNANLTVPLEHFRHADLRELVFRRNDSHLTIAGNALLAETVLSKLGISDFICPKIESKQVQHIGDLGNKFAPGIPEFIHVPQWNSGLFDQSTLTKVSDFSSTRVVGTEQEFENKHAPIDKSLLVFGNSFFERCPSWGLSPFFAALFRRFRFVWSADFNVDAIREWNPDVVICQTCERFLSKLPRDIAC